MLPDDACVVTVSLPLSVDPYRWTSLYIYTMFTLPWLLFFISSVSAAAIPVSSHSPSSVYIEESARVLAPKVLTQPPSSQSARHGDFRHLAKREPYYFPETTPFDDEIEERLISLREAGFVKSSSPNLNHKQPIKSIGAPDAVIDIPHASPILPDVEPSSTSQGSTTVPTWESSPILFPPLSVFFFVVLVVCVGTLIHGIKNDEKPAVVLNV